MVMNILEILTEDILSEIINFLKKRGFDKNEITFGFNGVIDVFNSLPEKFKIHRIIPHNSIKPNWVSIGL